MRLDPSRASRVQRCAVLAFLALSPLLVSGTCRSDVFWDDCEKCIRVMDYPEDAPATCDMLLEADRAKGWGKVSYDAATDTYTVNASVWIGTNQGLGTYFQVGRPGHPRETLLVKGEVKICAAKLSAKRPDGRYSVMNRLTLGHPSDSSIRAALKIACEKPGQYGLQVGEYYARRAELHVYNSGITADPPDADHRMGSRGMCGSDIRLINARISCFQGQFLYGVQAHNGTVQGTTIEHGSEGLYNGNQFARDCMFRSLGVAIVEGGCLNAQMLRCTFEDNDWNWTLGAAQSAGVDFIDCVIHPQKKPVSIRKNSLLPLLYPAFTDWRSVVVRVTDRRGKPLEGVIVHVESSDPSAVRNGLCVTDRKGETPADAGQNAILLVNERFQPTDQPDQPARLTYGYTVQCLAPGYREKKTAIPAVADIPRPFVIVLER